MKHPEEAFILVTFFVLAALSVAFGLRAAQVAPSGYVQGPDTFTQILVRPKFAPDETIEGFAVTAICEARRVEHVGPSGRAYTEPASLEIDFVKNGTRTVYVGDRAYRYDELAVAFAAACRQEWRQAHPPGTAPHRGMREPAPKYQPGPGQPVP